AEAALGPVEDQLRAFAAELAGASASSRVVVDADPASAILEAIDREAADTVVVGNLGMSGRKEFLLGNIPNRVSHNARCTVIIVNSGPQGRVAGDPVSTRRSEPGERRPREGELLARTF